MAAQVKAQSSVVDSPCRAFLLDGYPFFYLDDLVLRTLIE
jgi:hypothetical protein